MVIGANRGDLLRGGILNQIGKLVAVAGSDVQQALVKFLSDGPFLLNRAPYPCTHLILLPCRVVFMCFV